MRIIVQKFGGSSLASQERMGAVSRIIADTKRRGFDVVVVVSAMQGETDRLISLCSEVGELAEGVHAREYDALVSTGEQVSAALLSMHLLKAGLASSSYTAQQLALHTTGDHGRACITEVETVVLEGVLSGGVIPVVTGFQGVNQSGATTTLGRGGSDTSAVAIAAALGAEECQIYTDVDGIYTADPDIVSDATLLSEVNFSEMLELSSLGAQVIHPEALACGGVSRMPIRVLSSFTGSPGTLVTFEEGVGMEKPLVSGIASDRHQAQLTLRAIPMRAGLASYILGPISEANISIDMMTQSAPTPESLVDISFTVQRDDYDHIFGMLNKIKQEVSAREVLGNPAVSKLSVVGMGMRSHAGVVSKICSALGKEGIEIHSIMGSEIKISVLVDEKYIELGCRILHDTFGLSTLSTSSLGAL